MSYEKLRNEIITGLLQSRNVEDINSIMTVIDRSAIGYEIIQKCTDVTIADDCPQIVRLYIAAMAVENMSRQTAYQYFSTLKLFFGVVRKPFDAVTTNDIRAFLYSYQQQHGISNNTLNQYRARINAFFEWCVREEYITRNPSAKIGKIKPGPVKRPRMDALELETLRNACRTPREKALVDVFYSTGIRVSELIALLKSDIDFDDMSVVVRHGKGDKRRISYLNPEAFVSLKAYFDTRTDNCQYVFVSDRKPAHPLTKEAIEKALHKIAARTSIKVNVTHHAMRRTTGTLSIRRGMPIEQVQRLLGHANINTTITCYAQVDDSMVRDAHSKYTA